MPLAGIRREWISDICLPGLTEGFLINQKRSPPLESPQYQPFDMANKVSSQQWRSRLLLGAGYPRGSFLFLLRQSIVHIYQDTAADKQQPMKHQQETPKSSTGFSVRQVSVPTRRIKRIEMLNLETSWTLEQYRFVLTKDCSTFPWLPATPWVSLVL